MPETEAKGRLHSSAVAVVVLPEVPLDFQVDMKDFKIDFLKGGGPGGQSVNKTESACRVTHVPSGIQAFNQEQREQEANKRRAIEIVKEKLFKIEHDRYYEELSKRRKLQVSGSDRSDKIRTYNFPQDRITDHRMGYTRYGIQDFLSGNLVEDFIAEFRRKENEEKLQELLSK